MVWLARLEISGPLFAMVSGGGGSENGFGCDRTRWQLISRLNPCDAYRRFLAPKEKRCLLGVRAVGVADAIENQV